MTQEDSIIAPTILASAQVVTAIISGYCLVKVAQLKSHVNSRMDQLVALTARSEFAKGKLEGEKEKKP